MIEITHAQAEHLIRAGQDGRRLPDEQWSALQAHLERCERCRAYRARVSGLEHTLDHLLRERWRAVTMRVDAENETVPALLRRRRARAAWSRILRAVLPYVLGFLALLAFFIWQEYNNAQQERIAAARMAVTATPTRLIPTPSPTPGGGQFNELIAFPEMVNGAPDIILLNPSANKGAGEHTNLTHHPARDIDPIWSPDGAWIAFLSDRDGEKAGGKTELYVISVAGTRLTQLTNRPEIEWSGPLSWSADGRYIALTGWRDVTAMMGKHEPAHEGPHRDQSFIYFVSLDGSSADRLALTMNAPGPLRFSPAFNLLAYSAPNGEGLTVYDPGFSRYTQAAHQEAVTEGLETGAAGSFDWSPDGRRMVFIASPPSIPFNNTLKVTTDLVSVAVVYGGENVPLYRAGENRRITSLTYLPDRTRSVIAFLQEEANDPCITLHLMHEGFGTPPREIPGLCVQGLLSPGQWARGGDPDGEWLVVTAREQADPQGSLGYYAVRMPRDLALNHPAPYQRLADASPEMQSFASAAVRPRSEPAQPLLIDPRSYPFTGTPGAHPAAPAGLPGRIVYSVVLGPQHVLYSMRPDGTERTLISELNQDAICPSWSPDGQKLAFLSDRASAIHGAMEVFVMEGAANANPNDDRLIQLTDRVTSANPMADYPTCPLWSPDGTRLAVLTRNRSQVFLSLLAPGKAAPENQAAPVTQAAPENQAAPQAQAEPETIALPNVSLSTAPLLWTPDGQQLLLVTSGGFGSGGSASPLRIYAVDVRGEANPPQALQLQQQQQLQQPRVLAEFPNLVNIFGLAISPPGIYADGPRLAFVAQDPSMDALQLFTMRLDGSEPRSAAYLPRFPYAVGPASLAWLPDGRLVFPVRYPGHYRVKTELWQFVPEGSGLAGRERIALEELLIDAAWSANGRWLVYTSDAGLFLLSKDAALTGSAAPTLLTDQVVDAVDWK